MAARTWCSGSRYVPEAEAAVQKTTIFSKKSCDNLCVALCIWGDTARFYCGCWFHFLIRCEQPSKLNADVEVCSDAIDARRSKVTCLCCVPA